MEENENNPFLIAVNPLLPAFNALQKIYLSAQNFTLGRGLTSSVVIGYLSISRLHCTFRKNDKNNWLVEDHSSFGIKINNELLGKGQTRLLQHEDIIQLEPSEIFVYKFTLPSEDVFEPTPNKRMRMADSTTIIIDNVKKKFEQSQNCEIKYIQEKILNAKKMQETSMILKEQLQEDMNRKIQNLESLYSNQIESLKGEKNEVENQKVLLIEERDALLHHVKNEMEGKITDLMKQITMHVEIENKLQTENSSLKEKLFKEREEFLTELNRESTSKQEMLEKLEDKIKEQDESRQQEIQELQETLRRETELLRIAKEKELRDLEDQKRQRELELQQELSDIRKNLAEQVQQTEQQRLKAEQELNQQLEEMQKLKDEDKAKMDQLKKEREDIQTKLILAKMIAEKSILAEKARVTERETELAALAADRIQKQADQSSEVISTLQEQLERMKSQLLTVETEKNTILENISTDAGEGTSKQATLNEFGDLMESELQCSICAELFVEATVLNCSHTFCKYCITMWKKKKKDCPICRAQITKECKSLVLDSFIEKMVQNLTEEMKTKRQDMLKFRAELEAKSAQQSTSGTRRSSEFYEETDDEYIEEEEEYEGNSYNDYVIFGQERSLGYDTNDFQFDTDSGSDDTTDTDEPSGAPATATDTELGAVASTSADESSDTSGSDDASASDGGADNASDYATASSVPEVMWEDNAGMPSLNPAVVAYTPEMTMYLEESFASSSATCPTDITWVIDPAGRPMMHSMEVPSMYALEVPLPMYVAEETLLSTSVQTMQQTEMALVNPPLPTILASVNSMSGPLIHTSEMSSMHMMPERSEIHEIMINDNSMLNPTIFNIARTLQIDEIIMVNDAGQLQSREIPLTPSIVALQQNPTPHPVNVIYPTEIIMNPAMSMRPGDIVINITGMAIHVVDIVTETEPPTIMSPEIPDQRRRLNRREVPLNYQDRPTMNFSEITSFDGRVRLA